jgi:TRAP-type transport system periplasmic protein
MLSKLYALGSAACLVLALAGAEPVGAQEIVIKFPTVHGDPDAIFNRGGERIGEELENIMPGVFDFQLYPGSQLGNEREILEGLQLGTIEMTTSGVAGIADPILNIFDLPFLFGDRHHVYSVLDGEIGKEMLANQRDGRLVALGYFENGWRHITNNRRPIQEPADLEGLNQRVVEHDVYIATMQALGANTVPMAYGELYAALRTGVVDGQDNPLVNIWTAKFYEVQNYLTLSSHVYSNNVIFASRAFWDRLTEEQQDAIREAVARATEHQRTLSIAADKELLDSLAEHMEINEIEDRAAFVEATQSVYEKFSDQFPPELVERIRNVEVQNYDYAE